MTTPDERWRALDRAEQLLVDLSVHQPGDRIPLDMRKQ